MYTYSTVSNPFRICQRQVFIPLDLFLGINTNVFRFLVIRSIANHGRMEKSTVGATNSIFRCVYNMPVQKVELTSVSLWESDLINPPPTFHLYYQLKSTLDFMIIAEFETIKHRHLVPRAIRILSSHPVFVHDFVVIFHHLSSWATSNLNSFWDFHFSVWWDAMIPRCRAFWTLSHSISKTTHYIIHFSHSSLNELGSEWWKLPSITGRYK